MSGNPESSSLAGKPIADPSRPASRHSNWQLDFRPSPEVDKQGAFFRRPWHIGQVAFIGGDVSRDSLKQASDWSNPMFHRIMRLTNYSSRFDKRLGVSNA